mmetsp:Transcript_47449/g.111674  ORF Transcript_47449/g.111674 Transcript_47449/m.111674 type:complete len:208 (+) Transcript_47449:168-791(+)
MVRLLPVLLQVAQDVVQLAVLRGTLLVLVHVVMFRRQPLLLCHLALLCIVMAAPGHVVRLVLDRLVVPSLVLRVLRRDLMLILPRPLVLVVVSRLMLVVPGTGHLVVVASFLHVVSRPRRVLIGRVFRRMIILSSPRRRLVSVLVVAVFRGVVLVIGVVVSKGVLQFIVGQIMFFGSFRVIVHVLIRLVMPSNIMQGFSLVVQKISQ